MEVLAQWLQANDDWMRKLLSGYPRMTNGLIRVHISMNGLLQVRVVESWTHTVPSGYTIVEASCGEARLYGRTIWVVPDKFYSLCGM